MTILLQLNRDDVRLFSTEGLGSTSSFLKYACTVTRKLELWAIGCTPFLQKILRAPLTTLQRSVREQWVIVATHNVILWDSAAVCCERSTVSVVYVTNATMRAFVSRYHDVLLASFHLSDEKYWWPVIGRRRRDAYSMYCIGARATGCREAAQ